MKNLHKIKKEITGYIPTPEEQHGLRHLYSIGYTRFRHRTDGMFDIFPTGGNSWILEIMPSYFADREIRIGTPEFSIEWIVRG